MKLPVARQVSLQVEPLSTSATVATKSKKWTVHRVIPFRETGLAWPSYANNNSAMIYCKRGKQNGGRSANLKQHFETSFKAPQQVSNF